MLDQVINGQFRTVGEVAVAAPGVLVHLFHGVEGIRVVEHSGLVDQIGLPLGVELLVVVGRARNRGTDDVGSVVLRPFKYVRIAAGLVELAVPVAAPEQEAHGHAGLEDGVGPA